MTWAAVGIGALIGGGTAAISGGNVLEGAALGGLTGGGGAYMNGLLAGSASGAAGAAGAGGAVAPGAASASEGMFSNLLGTGAGKVPMYGETMTTAASNAGFTPSQMGSLSKEGMDSMLINSQNMTMPAPSFMDKMSGFMPGEVDPNRPEGALARDALPKEKAGFGQQLTSGLLRESPLLKPNERQTPTPASGPALSRPAPQPAGNMYKFDRWRK